jgi:plastocyanin
VLTLGVLLAGVSCSRHERSSGPEDGAEAGVETPLAGPPATKAGDGRRRHQRTTPRPEVSVTQAPDAASDAPIRIEGVVLFDGTPPKRKPLATGGKAGCEHEGSKQPLSETVIVTDGRVQNALAYLSEGIESWPGPPEADVVLRQVGCVYTPHVVGLQTGQTIRVVNGDPTSHNVHVYSKYATIPNRTQAEGGQDLKMVFERAELGVLFACDKHPWMKSYVCVIEHPFFAVTGPDGRFVIEGVPPGEYDLTLWHEKYGRQSVRIVLIAGSQAEIRFTLGDS